VTATPEARGTLPLCVLAIGGLLLFLAPVSASAQTVFVDDDNCPGPGSGTDLDPYCKIQDAICAVKNGGGTVEVRDGTYRESLRMFPGVSLQSVNGAEKTILDAADQPCITSNCTVNTSTTTCSAVVYGSGHTVADRLEGFTITGGAGIFRQVSGSNFVAGGAIFMLRSSPTITNNMIVDNVMTSGQTDDFRGGAFYIEGGDQIDISAPTITNNVIARNVADPPAGTGGGYLQSYARGGAFYIGQFGAGTIQDNLIEGNRAGSDLVTDQFGEGGAFAIYSLHTEPTISRNIIRQNASSDVGGAIFMGEVYLDPQTAPSYALIENNVIEYNTARFDGGAAHTRTTEVRFRNNTISDNTVNAYGGGLYIGNSENNNDQVDLINNVVAFNYTDSYSGQGGGVYVAIGANPTISSTDLFGNTPTNVGGSKSDGDYVGSNGNISLDPTYANPGPRYRNARLSAGSPILDAGDNGQSPPDDKDGRSRPIDGDGNATAVSDPGAYEFDPAAGPDFDGDGIDDLTDSDDDNDGVDDLSDCDPLDNVLTQVAGPTGATISVSKSGFGAVLEWQRGVQGYVSNVYRGDITQPWTYNETCFITETSDTSGADAALPAVGSAFYYLVSAKNGCGESRMGRDNFGGVQSDTFPSNPCVGLNLDRDSDGILDVRDNCVLAANAGQFDADLDFIGDACDCAPFDAANPPPGEVQGVTLIDALGITDVSWAIVEGLDVVYDVASGALSGLANGGTVDATCLSDDQPTASYTDLRGNPPPGDGVYYLVRTENGCGAGSWGLGSAGGERPATACP
jgi:hypothetical protein